MQVVLGSQSPRRKEILGYFSLPFVQVAPPFDEESVSFDGHPEKYVRALSQGKAQALAASFPEAVLITADTVVFQEGKIFNKPQTEEEAFQMLSKLVGTWHTVYTGVTVQQGKGVFSEVEATRVLFNPLSSEQIRHYIAHSQWKDKAGGYAIQGKGGILVRRIEGCYYNVMGLPTNTLEQLLRRVGIELWDYF